MLTACHPGVVLERVAYGFVSGGDQGHEFGPSGVVFGSSGTWMAANGATGELFRLHGTNAEAVDPLNPAAGVIDLTVGPAGELYGSRASQQLSRLIPRPASSFGPWLTVSRT